MQAGELKDGPIRCGIRGSQLQQERPQTRAYDRFLLHSLFTGVSQGRSGSEARPGAIVAAALPRVRPDSCESFLPTSFCQTSVSSSATSSVGVAPRQPDAPVAAPRAVSRVTSWTRRRRSSALRASTRGASRPKVYGRMARIRIVARTKRNCVVKGNRRAGIQLCGALSPTLKGVKRSVPGDSLRLVAAHGRPKISRDLGKEGQTGRGERRERASRSRRASRTR